MGSKYKFYFERALSQARELFTDREELKNTLDRAFKKVTTIEDENSEIGQLVIKVKLFIRMVKAYVEGEYREIPWKTMLLVLGSLIYFLNPFDLVPDFLPGVGYLDDITIVLWVFKSVEDDIAQFQEYFYTSEEM